MDETFSQSQDMAKYGGNGGKLLEEQESLLKVWTTIGIVGLCSFSNEKVGKNNFSKEGVN